MLAKSCRNTRKNLWCFQKLSLENSYIPRPIPSPIPNQEFPPQKAPPYTKSVATNCYHSPNYPLTPLRLLQHLLSNVENQNHKVVLSLSSRRGYPSYHTNRKQLLLKTIFHLLAK